MSTTKVSPVMTGNPPDDEMSTTGIPLEAGLSTLPPEVLFADELSAKVDRAAGSQTEAEPANGGSPRFASRLDQFPVVPPTLRLSREYFKTLQKWEGYVLEVGEETFHARLVPIIGEGGDQEAEIYLEEVDEEDRPLIEPGAVFYWSIGYLHRPGRIRAAVIRFRRLPKWSRFELEAAEAETIQLKSLFDDE